MCSDLSFQNSIIKCIIMYSIRAANKAYTNLEFFFTSQYCIWERIKIAKELQLYIEMWHLKTKSFQSCSRIVFLGTLTKEKSLLSIIADSCKQCLSQLRCQQACARSVA